jgi:hypothetical protein
MSAAFQADIERRLSGFGVEPEALAWVVKALHPAGPLTPVGLPDSSYVNSVRPEYRTQAIVGSPMTLTTPTWDLCVIRVPGDVCQTYWMSGNSGSDFNTGVGVQANGALPVRQWSFPSTSNYFITYPQPNVNYVVMAGALTEDGVVAWRTSYSSVTCYLTASALNDQGTVFSTQLARAPSRGICTNNTTITTPPLPTAALGGAVVQTWRMQIPLNEEDMLLMDPRAYTAPARDGVYLPIRLTGPVQAFTPAISSAPSVSLVTGEIVSDITDATGSVTVMNQLCPPIWGVGVANPVTNANFYNSCPDNSYYSVTIFRGLSPAASVTIKSYIGLELEIAPGSILQQFSKVPALYSPRAIEAYLRAIQEMPNCYPSSWNSLGAILSGIATVASKLWPVVQKVVPAIGAGIKSAVADYEARSAAESRETKRVQGPLSERQVVATSSGGPVPRRRSLSARSVTMKVKRRGRRSRSALRR